MKFNIVSNTTLLKLIKNIDIFELDLGVSAINKKSGSVEIKDNFIDQYLSNKNTMIRRFGKIGTIDFFVDLRLPSNELHIYANNKEFDLVYEDGDLPIKSYISKSLQMIEEHIIESSNELEVVAESTNKGWVATDEKNRGKVYEINQQLSREEYSKEFARKRMNG